MDDAPDHRLDDPSAVAEFLAVASPSDEGRALAREGESPRALLGRLGDAGHFPDAVKLLALALPRPSAVWWACRCCREAPIPDEAPAALAALEAAERWAAEPSEDLGRAAHAAAEATGLEAPAACAALGAFFAGPSLAPPNLPAVPPAPHLTAHVVAGAVMLAAVRSEPEKAPSKYRAFLALGLAVADGADRPAPVAAAAVAPIRTPATSRPDRRGADAGRPAAPSPTPTPASSPAPPPARPSTAPAPPRTRRWDEWE